MVVVCIGIGMLEDRLKLRYVLVFVVIVIVCMVVDFMSSLVSELVSWCWMYSTMLDYIE